MPRNSSEPDRPSPVNEPAGRQAGAGDGAGDATRSKKIAWTHTLIMLHREVREAVLGCGRGKTGDVNPKGDDVKAFDLVADDAMLERAAELLSDRGIDAFETRRATAEEAVLEAGAYDFIASFNAVHHFDLGAFLGACRVALAPGAHLFVYTRLPEQNARTIWGRHFRASPNARPGSRAWAICTARSNGPKDSGSRARPRSAIPAWPRSTA